MLALSRESQERRNTHRVVCSFPAEISFVQEGNDHTLPRFSITILDVSKEGFRARMDYIHSTEFEDVLRNIKTVRLSARGPLGIISVHSRLVWWKSTYLEEDTQPEYHIGVHFTPQSYDTPSAIPSLIQTAGNNFIRPGDFDITETRST